MSIFSKKKSQPVESVNELADRLESVTGQLESIADRLESILHESDKNSTD